MTDDEALAFWYGRINYEQRAPKASDLKLDRMRALLKLLGDPQRYLRIVHVAGSKGKGSISAMLATILRRAGYRTGLFTSPHLSRVEERMQIDDTSITSRELHALLNDVQPAVRALENQGDPGALGPTFFEVATAVGFLHFFRRRTDIAVVEVGLGGRFDSTNVCQPLLSVIASISLDHTQQLGDRLASIAMEKAGIVKPGHPVISGATPPEARAVIAAICRERKAPLHQVHEDFHYTYEPGHVTAENTCHARVQVITNRRVWPALELGLLGEHQAANAAVVVASVEELQSAGLHLSDQAVADGLAQVNWPARLEVMGCRPLVVLDCAHNVASAQALIDTLQLSFPKTRRRLIFAVSNDKDVPGILQVLGPHFDHVYLTRYRGNPRFVPPERLAEMLRKHRTPPAFTMHANAEDAWQAARAAAAPDDLLCITGSVFLAGELRPLIAAHELGR